MGNGRGCWHCGGELIWGGDFDLEDVTGEQGILTNLTCSCCGADVDYTIRFEEEQ